MTVSVKTGISLRTQLYSLVIGIALVTFIGASWVSIETTRTYLNEQMTSHAQDAATSVGLSISPFMDGENPVIVETMILAIFDSGYYQQVSLTDADSNIIMSRKNDIIIDGVPAWFIDVFELSSPIMSSEVNNGWNIAGVLSFQSHVGSSYIKLWQHAVNNFYSTLLIALAALFIAHLILRAVLNPLSKVEAQALSVSKKNFTFIKKLPMTRELKTVINAMNIMVRNIEASFDIASKQADKLSNELFIDDLTKLGNRRAFQNQFEAAVNNNHDNELSTLGFIQLHSLQSINTELGYKAGDQYVCKAAQLVTEKLSNFSGAKAYRVNGGSFFFTIYSSGEDVMNFCQEVNNAFEMLNSSYYEQGFGKLVATTYDNDAPLSNLLAKLDTLLTQEISATSVGEVYSETKSDSPYGLQQWSELIDALVKTKHIEFAFQPVVSSSAETPENVNPDNNKPLNNNDVLYYELFSKFLHNNKSVENNQLYAMAERTQKSQELDKLILEHLAHIDSFCKKTKVAINLTHQSLHSVEFKTWLVNFIRDNKPHLPKLVFEVNEEAILAGITSSINFIQLVKSLGIEVCIDRFGASFTSFKYLKGLDVDYLKIDGAYIHQLSKTPENKHFVQAVTQIGHGVGIKILASHVESMETKLSLLALDCDGFQGNFVQKTLGLLNKSSSVDCIYSPINVS